MDISGSQVPLQQIKAGSFRTKKEWVYLGLIALISLLFWVGGGYFTYVSVKGFSKPEAAKKECFLKDPESGELFIIEESQLLFGEKCLDEKTLKAEEMELARQNIVDMSKDEKNKQLADSFAGIGIVIAILLFSFFSHLLAMAYIRMNGVKVGPDQLPNLWNAIKAQSGRLGIKTLPDTFIINGQGMINAFATKLVRRKLLVLYSDLVEALMDDGDQKQLESVIAHELGHHALGHTRLIQWLLFPGEMFPLLSSAWSREREYSADRVMMVLSDSALPCERALVKLAAGRQVGNAVNIQRFVDQAREERGFFTWLTEIVATHPHLPKRIIAIRKMVKPQGSGIQQILS